ncbi:gamma-glutamylcyclotransferase [Halotalea alkalilenta]|uniref:gamma-glutamylcyclotransferase n=1 Tax=Halotalea alkalilenta TaxID=376489 RepID=UPI0009DDBA73|nr:gamma-glutamylcyclotransferase [Halotalea alkalilenta]
MREETSCSAAVATSETIPMTRQTLEHNLIRHYFERHYPDIALFDDDALRDSIRAMLERRPEEARGVDGVFLFAYGSLIWNPCVEVVEHRTSRLYGYHRDFRLKLTHGRGSEQWPGLMLALVPGGSCRGMAIRVPEAGIEHELLLVWRREMLTGAYQPRWVRLVTEQGPTWAIAFVGNPHHPRYIPRLTDAEMVELLSTGRGVLGSCREYLHNTVNDLHRLAIRDQRLERLLLAVDLRRE